MRGLGKKVDLECQRCHTLTWMPGTHALCKPCLKDQGLRECRACTLLLPESLSFLPKKGVCRKCDAETRRRRRGSRRRS